MAPQNSISLVKNARLYRPTPGCTGVLPLSGAAAYTARRLPAAAHAARCFEAAVRGQVTAGSRRSGQANGGLGLPAALSSLGDNGGMDSAAHVEARGEPQEARPERRLQMIGDLVGNGLVVGAAITKRPDVELQGFELHAQPVGHVLEVERCEVRLPGAWTQAGELGDLHADGVVTIGGRVGEGLELRGGR